MYPEILEICFSFKVYPEKGFNIKAVLSKVNKIGDL